MIPALWISKSGLDAQQTNISVTSNNLANASTVGYKKGRAVFEDLLYQNVNQPGGRSSADTTLPSGLMLGAGAKVVATQKQFGQGDVQTTNNTLDLMISGDGFFEIQMPDGTTKYTRNGQFTLNQEGTIVTVGSGYPLLPEIQVPENAKSITVGKDGQVSVTTADQAESQVLGQITVTTFVNNTSLEPIGENLFAETSASNVTEELVNLITAQRVYEMNSKVLHTVDQMMGNLVQTL